VYIYLLYLADYEGILDEPEIPDEEEEEEDGEVIDISDEINALSEEDEGSPEDEL